MNTTALHHCNVKNLRFWLFFAPLVALGGTSVLGDFILLRGTNSILRTFLGGTFRKKHSVKEGEILKSILFELHVRQRRNQNNQFYGVQLHTKVVGKVPGPSAREMGEITCWINEQRRRGQKATIIWLVVASYLFFVIVQVLDR